MLSERMRSLHGLRLLVASGATVSPISTTASVSTATTAVTETAMRSLDMPGRAQRGQLAAAGQATQPEQAADQRGVAEVLYMRRGIVSTM